MNLIMKLVCYLDVIVKILISDFEIIRTNKISKYNFTTGEFDQNQDNKKLNKNFLYIYAYYKFTASTAPTNSSACSSVTL